MSVIPTTETVSLTTDEQKGGEAATTGKVSSEAGGSSAATREVSVTTVADTTDKSSGESAASGHSQSAAMASASATTANKHEEPIDLHRKPIKVLDWTPEALEAIENKIEKVEFELGNAVGTDGYGYYPETARFYELTTIEFDPGYFVPCLIFVIPGREYKVAITYAPLYDWFFWDHIEPGETMRPVF